MQLVPGSAPVVVAPDQKFPSYLAADEDWLYWTDDDRDADSGSIRRIAK